MSQTIGTETRSAGVLLNKVSKSFGNLKAVKEVTIDIASGEFFSLLGPSGCGKTTLLRIIAGFEQPESGSVVIGGVDLTRRPPQERPTAMVFQNYALFPTMTVGENVAYGLNVRKMKRNEASLRVAESLARVDLAGYEQKPVTQLSGGQQQRVALARALAVQPDVILFDEPLSNLDVALREQTRRELKTLQNELGTTSIYVTHDQQEALALSDRIAVMRDGQLQQLGSPETLYQTPETAFVATFLGGSNIISHSALAEALAGEEAPSQKHVLSVRPEHFEVIDEETAPVFQVKGRQFLGMYTEWWLQHDETEVRIWRPPVETYQDRVRLKVSAYNWVLASE